MFQFTMINILTGIIVEQVLVKGQKKENEILAAHHEEASLLKRDSLEIFKQMDIDDNGHNEPRADGECEERGRVYVEFYVYHLSMCCTLCFKGQTSPSLCTLELLNARIARLLFYLEFQPSSVTVLVNV